MRRCSYHCSLTQAICTFVQHTSTFHGTCPSGSVVCHSLVTCIVGQVWCITGHGSCPMVNTIRKPPWFHESVSASSWSCSSCCPSNVDPTLSPVPMKLWLVIVPVCIPSVMIECFHDRMFHDSALPNVAVPHRCQWVILLRRCMMMVMCMMSAPTIRSLHCVSKK